MEVEIISEEIIKPASPTPHHLRTFKLSLLDQLFPPHHVPLIFFYPKNQSTSLTNTIPEKSRRLKQSLSETLARFYPFAGKIKDDLYIDCNDEGVYFVEARAHAILPKFLGQHGSDQLTHHLLPQYPNSMDSSVGKYVLMIQFNSFDCGGIALSVCASHKIIDGHTYSNFLKEWAARANKSLEPMNPISFIAPILFPQNISLPKDSRLVIWPPTHAQKKCITRRFVFDASALAALKAQAISTRVQAVSALLWKCAMAASKSRHGSQRRSVLALAVNLRGKFSPPLPEFSIGNLVWSAIAQYMPKTKMELDSLVGHIGKGITRVNSDFVKELQGHEGFFKVNECLKEMVELYSNGDTDCFNLSSLVNTGLYEVDFGCGNPVWVSLGSSGEDKPRLMNLVRLMDTLSGGIEAWVTLCEQDMAIFECDTELLTFATVDPNPIKLGVPQSLD